MNNGSNYYAQFAVFPLVTTPYRTVTQGTHSSHLYSVFSHLSAHRFGFTASFGSLKEDQKGKFSTIMGIGQNASAIVMKSEQRFIFDSLKNCTISKRKGGKHTWVVNKC